VTLRPLSIDGAWAAAPEPVAADFRGSFREWFEGGDFLAATGRTLTLAQANCSTSRKGVVRGIHFTGGRREQAKYVTCVSGSILDVVVDVREGSPTFGKWEAVQLTRHGGGAVFLSEGLGHAWMALTSSATMTYLCTQPYNPAAERAVSPRDPAIGIAWPEPFTMSARDAAAPRLAEAAALGLLPAWPGPPTGAR
jgi:dTDP-4-dehydrorhamnose 3,5-epimerase